MKKSTIAAYWIMDQRAVDPDIRLAQNIVRRQKRNAWTYKRPEPKEVFASGINS